MFYGNVYIIAPAKISYSTRGRINSFPLEAKMLDYCDGIMVYFWQRAYFEKYFEEECLSELNKKISF